MFYPDIPAEVVLSLDIIRQKLEADEFYLDESDCPYSEDLKDMLRGLVKPSEGDVGEIVEVDWDWADPEALGKQIDKALRDIEVVGKNLMSLEPNERIAYLKAKSGLLEKLVSMKERAVNIKQINDFRSLVIETLERHLDAAAITEFRKELEVQGV